MKNIGIIGGTFDPVHTAHIEMAKAAKKQFNLDEIIFVPGGNTPHKKEITPANLRYEMLKCALENEFEVSDYEIKKESFSYTADTLEHFKQKFPNDKLFFVMGADSLDYIDSWHEPKRIFSLADIIVFARDDFDVAKKSAALEEKYSGKILLAREQITDIASTRLRLYIDMGFSVENFIPEKAYEFIIKNDIYAGKFTEMREKVKRAEKESRFLHTLGVCRTAVRMSEIFGEDIEKTYTAALLHDVAKNIPEDEMYGMCEKYNIDICNFEKENPQVVHAKVGAYIAEKHYGVKDGEILSAIKWHTLGKLNMTRLEKIIFVADMAEEGRMFEGVDRIRNAAFSDLDKAVSECINQTIAFNEKLGRTVYEGAYLIRDELGKKHCKINIEKNVKI